jgi:type IV secretory pathway VirJ component
MHRIRYTAAFVTFCIATRLPCQQPPADSASVRDLPLLEIPATQRTSDVLVVFMTGDGGWASLDKQVAAALVAHGAAVVGLNSRAYLSKKRTPDEVANDVARVARHYLQQWQRSRLVIAGYSRGADLAPFVATRLPPDLKARLALVAMLGLGTRTGFEFHWQDIVRTVRRPSDLQTLPELERLRGTRMLCVYGTEETDSACPAAAELAQSVPRTGTHHFDGDYRALGELIWQSIPPAA